MIKKTLVTFLIAFVFSPAFAQEEKHSHMSMKKEGMMAPRQALLEGEKQEVLNVLKANEPLRISFFRRDYSGAEKAAKDVINAIDKLSNQTIKATLAFAKGKLAQIGPAQSRKDNNQNYHLISMALLHIVGKYDVGNVYNGYYCPMEKKKWVQNSEKTMEAQNPFASDNMPNCGEMITQY